jgi:hypothetical protein
MEVSGQLHALAPLPYGKESLGTHWIGSWAGPRAGLEAPEKKKSYPRWEPNTELSSNVGE